MSSVGIRVDPNLAAVAAAQDPDGCFASWLEPASGPRVADRNGFVTALVLRTLRGVIPRADTAPFADRALDWLERCRSTTLPGAFGFWPESGRPAWAAGLPPDADDTAVLTAELLRHGRLDRAAALRVVCRVLLPARSDPRAPRPDWVTPGSFLTWLGPPPGRRSRPWPANPVDCCVNANVVALLASLDASHLPGHDAAVETVRRGVAWAGDEPARWSALTPFYPGPHSLAEALAHAVECGAEALRAAAEQATRAAAAVADRPATARPPGLRPELRSAYGRTTWYAPVLDDARLVAGAALTREGTHARPRQS